MSPNLSNCTCLLPSTAVFSPVTRKELKSAVITCLKRWSPQGDCSKSPYGPIAMWDVSRVTDMTQMFYGSLEFGGDISNWDVSRVTNMRYIFWGAMSFNGDISKWDVSSVTSMAGAFFITPFNGDISKWDVSSVTDMSFMFYAAALFDGDISNWDVSSVTDMKSMFQSAKAFNGDISKWDVLRVTDMKRMFSGATSFKQTLCKSWSRSKAKMYDMFTDSHGSISPTECTGAPPTTLPVSAPVTPPSTSPAIQPAAKPPTATAVKCPKCPPLTLFILSLGTPNCCFIGGAWYNQCGDTWDPRFSHTWEEGERACEYQRRIERTNGGIW